MLGASFFFITQRGWQRVLFYLSQSSSVFENFLFKMAFTFQVVILEGAIYNTVSLKIPGYFGNVSWCSHYHMIQQPHSWAYILIKL